MRKREAPFQFGIEYLAFRAATTVIRRLSLPGARRFGRRLGAVGWAALGRHRRIALDNLRRHLPDLSADERRQIVRGSFENLGSAVCEVIQAVRIEDEEIDRRFLDSGLMQGDRR